MRREEVFQQWMEVKEDIQNLAAMCQNDMKIPEEELLAWCNACDKLKQKLVTLQLSTVRLVRLV